MSDYLENPHKITKLIDTTITIDDDRLSSLPDSLLVDILSLVPLKIAVTTSIVSRRWRNLWRQIPHLIFDSVILPCNPRRHDNPDDIDPFRQFQRFITIANPIVDHFTPTQVQTFKAIFPFPNPYYDREYDFAVSCTRSLYTWVPFVCARNVVHFTVNMSRHRVVLPSCVFHTESIVELNLDGVHCVFTNINLPRLKKLELKNNVYESHKGLAKLIKSCPILEDLCLGLSNFREGEVVVISAENLKSLSVQINQEDINLVIDAPMLENFSMEGYLCSCEFVTFMSRLIKVKLHIRIDLLRPFDEIDFSRLLPPFLFGICNAKCLHLSNGLNFISSNNFLNKFEYVDRVGSRFSNLTHLTLNLCSEYSSAFCNSMDDSPISQRIMRKLKRIDLLNIGGHDHKRIMKLVKYILCEGTVLKLLYITSVCDVCGSGYVEHETRLFYWERKVSRKIMAISNCFPRCRIKFIGGYISALSANFQSSNSVDGYTRNRMT